MTEEVAKIVILCGAFVGIIVWMAALAFYRKMAAADENEYFEIRLPRRTPEDAIAGVVDEAKQFAGSATLSRPSPVSFAIEQFGVQAHFAAERAGGETRLVAGLDDTRMRRKYQLAMGALVLVVMPAVVVGLPAALWAWVAPSPQQGVRWQVVQVAQMVHVLWPPFLVYYIWRQLRRRMASTVSNLLVLVESKGT